MGKSLSIKIVSLILAFSILFSGVAHASIVDAFQYGVYTFDQFLSNAVMGIKDGGYYAEGTVGWSLIDWWNALVHGDTSFKDEYSTYLSTLDSAYGTSTFDSYGILLPSLLWSKSSSSVDVLNHTGAVFEANYTSSLSFRELRWYFDIPASGNYVIHMPVGSCSCGSSHAYSGSDYYFGLNLVGSGRMFYDWYSSDYSYSIGMVGGEQYYVEFWGGPVSTTLIGYHKFSFEYCPYMVRSDYIAPPESTTRCSSLMQTINNYNIDNSYIDNSTTVNYFIGSLGDDGSVTDVYSPALYDEETLIFTEPISGTQYQTTGWTYDYTTRSYDLTLAPGTMTVADTDITQVICTYGDDAVTISYCDSSGTAVQTDEFAYVMASQSECNINGHTYNVETTKEPTCTAAGERTYTCSICGNQYVEEISKTDHTYADYTITQEPTCTAGGIASYTCSTCGAQITEKLDALGHDWLASEVTETTYEVPEGTSCPDCSGTAFTHTRSDTTFTCTCSDCGAEWTVEADVTYGSTTFTCSRCGETYVESEDPDSGLFAALANFLSDGITWLTDKFTELAESINGIHTTFRSYLQKIQNVGGDFPALLGAVIGVLPEDFMAVVWFSIVALVILAVWLKFFK